MTTEPTKATITADTNNASHTPGPWYLRAGHADWGMPLQHEVWGIDPDADGDDGTERDCVALVLSMQPYPLGAKEADIKYSATQFGNAKLIAAAPELLYALADMINEFQPHTIGQNNAFGKAMAIYKKATT